MNGGLLLCSPIPFLSRYVIEAVVKVLKADAYLLYTEWCSCPCNLRAVVPVIWGRCQPQRCLPCHKGISDWQIPPLHSFGFLLSLRVSALGVSESSISDWSPSLGFRIILLHGGCHSTWADIGLQPCLPSWIKVWAPEVCHYCVIRQHFLAPLK